MQQVEVGTRRPMTSFSPQVRAAALAARQAAHIRSKCQQSQPRCNASAAFACASGPAVATGINQPAPKKMRQLKLRLDAVPDNKSDFFVIEAAQPGMAAGATFNDADGAGAGFIDRKNQEIQQPWCVSSSSPPPQQLPPPFMNQSSSASSSSRPRPACSPFQQQQEQTGSPSRRRSSLTMDLNQTPQGKEFEEVAHDGPNQLGRKTKKIRLLGKGSSGSVYLSVYLPLLKLVAVKEVTIVHKQDRDLVRQELHALHENLLQMDQVPATGVVPTPAKANRRLSFAALSQHEQGCNYLLGFYGAYLVPYRSILSIVMEFMDMGSLQDLVDSKLVLHESILRQIAFCGLTALDHMHQHRLIHRDIKPANILCSRSGQFKVSDFGLAGELASGNGVASEFEGTVMYMAPERLLGQEYSYPSDIWSLGLTLFTLAAGGYPFQVEDGFFGVEEAITQEPLPPLPRSFSGTFRDFIKQLLQRDPSARLSAQQALQHPFLVGYDATCPEFVQFPQLWQQAMAGPTKQQVLAPNDIEAIAQLLVEYAAKYPDLVQLPKASQLHHSHKGLLHQMTSWWGGNKSPTSKEANRRKLENLAHQCGLELEEFLHVLPLTD